MADDKKKTFYQSAMEYFEKNKKKIKTEGQTNCWWTDVKK